MAKKKTTIPVFSPRATSTSTLSAQAAAASSPTGSIDIKFQGTFQCRLATDPDASTAADGRFGWTFAYGEAAFDRIIRFSNPVALRNALYLPWQNAVVTSVNAPGIPNSGSDSVIGQAVNLGPNTFFNGNNTTGGSPQYPPGQEPLVNFKFIVGSNSLYGEATNPVQGGGAALMTAQQLSSFGINPPAIYNNKLTQVTAPPLRVTNVQVYSYNNWGVTSSTGVYTPGIGKIEYVAICRGQLDKNIAINAGSSAVLNALVGQTPLYLKISFFGFDPDTLVGQVIGHVSNTTIP
jgi:hypothetical protein